MASHQLKNGQLIATRDLPKHDTPAVDYVWLAAQFREVTDVLAELSRSLASIDEKLQQPGETAQPAFEREFYSIVEFAELVGKSAYTVREWCRLERIHAEKCDSGRGDAKAWKIAVAELARYHDHGLLPMKYLR